MKQTTQNVLGRIKDAGTPEEIEDLLYEGRGFDHASDRTRHRWKKAARRRREELEK